MYNIISTFEQYKGFKAVFTDYVPLAIWESLDEKLKILDKFYGNDRNLDDDMGGYCVVFHPCSPMDWNEYTDILSKYRLRQGDWEYRKENVDKNSLKTWIEELYLISNDYGIIIFYYI